MVRDMDSPELKISQRIALAMVWPRDRGRQDKFNPNEPSGIVA